MNILGLGTYPIVNPVHGGQRRVSAFRDYYHSVGARYTYASVYQSAHYSGSDVSSTDIPIGDNIEDAYSGIPFIDDVRAGLQAANTDYNLIYRKLLTIVERVEPDIIQLEQPFMWPFVKKLRDMAAYRSMPVIYSSQNVEAPLKRDVLLSANVPPQSIHRADILISGLEDEICKMADLIIACSSSDKTVYEKMKPRAACVLVPNGVDRPIEPCPNTESTVRDVFGDNKFLFFVGSAYPPNISGFVEQVIDDGMFFVPPEKSIAICGGLCDGIFQTQAYLRYLEAHSDRVHFFSSPTDPELSAITKACHGVVLPVTFGGGSNLKTAQALALGKWIVATPTAMRGFETFRRAKGVIIAKNPQEFRRAMSDVLNRPPLELTAAQNRKRESVYWDEAFKKAAIMTHVSSLPKVLA